LRGLKAKPSLVVGLEFFFRAKDMMKRHPRHITVTLRWPERYFTGLKTRAEKLQREKELLKRRKTPHPKLSKSDKVTSTRPKSRWTQLFHKVYPGKKPKNVPGIRSSDIDTVYARGLKAWKTGGSRVGATAQQWGLARVYKFILVSKKKAPKAWYITRFDPDQSLRT
jgi:hypothetical protein